MTDFEKIKKEVEEKVAGYKGTLKWCKESNKTPHDIECVEHALGAYQDILYRIIDIEEGNDGEALEREE